MKYFLKPRHSILIWLAVYATTMEKAGWLSHFLLMTHLHSSAWQTKEEGEKQQHPNHYMQMGIFSVPAAHRLSPF